LKLNSKKIRVALTMRVTEAPTYIERRDSISHDWIKLICEWGMVPFLIPNKLDNPTEYLDSLSPDILILTGGDDLGKTPGRDKTEFEILAHALYQNLPILGICRGLQLINQYFGGSLSPVESHVAIQHPINFNTEIFPIYGNALLVNSYHNQTILPAGLGEGLTAVGVDENGGIEAALCIDRPVAGLMWHPERGGAPANDKIVIERLALEGIFWR